MAIFSDLPDDVIAKIWSLLPMPLKPVLRLKAVDKSWNILVKALVKIPSFAAILLKDNELEKRTFLRFTISGSKGEKKLKLLKQPWELVNDNPKKVNAPEEPCGKQVATISAHCDGMVCSVDLFQGTVKIRNPLTGEIRRLPRLDSLDEHVAVGFGHDPKSGAYKVAVFHKLFRGGSFEAKVCTVGENTWRRVGSLCLQKLTGFARHHTRSAVSCNGVAYWTADFESEDHVVCFRLDLEKFEVFGFNQSMKLISLGRLNGSLAILMMPKGKNLVPVFWVMTINNIDDWDTPFEITDPSIVGDQWFESGEWDPSVLSMTGLIFFDCLDNKYVKICSEGEKIDRVTLAPHYDYAFTALP